MAGHAGLGVQALNVNRKRQDATWALEHMQCNDCKESVLDTQLRKSTSLLTSRQNSRHEQIRQRTHLGRLGLTRQKPLAVQSGSHQDRVL